MPHPVLAMSIDDLPTKLDAFALSASPPKQQPSPPPALNAVALATSGERIVLLDIGRTSLERVPGSSSTGNQRTTVMEAVLQRVQSDFPGTACTIKGGASTPGCEMVFCFPNTPEGLRGFDWFHGQGKQCRMPLPDSDIMVHIPMKAFVSQPRVGGMRPVVMYLRDVPSSLWKDGIAALFLQHYGIQCEVKAEYAPNFRFEDTVYPGMLHKGVIKAELDPAPACDFSKLPKSVDVGGKLIKLQVYGHSTQPHSLPGRSAPSSPRAPAAAPSRRARARQRTRSNKAQHGGQGNTAQDQGEEDLPPAPPRPSSPPPPGPPPLQSGLPPASLDHTVHATSVEQSALSIQVPPRPAVSEASGGSPCLAPPAPALGNVGARAAATTLHAMPPQASRTTPPAAEDNTVAVTTAEQSPRGSARTSPTRGRKGTRATPAAAPPTMSRTSTEAAAGFETPNQYAPLAGVAADPGDHVLACPGDETVTATEGRRAPSARIAAQGRKTYTDTGPIPVVSSGGRAMDRPTEPPIPAAI